VAEEETSMPTGSNRSQDLYRRLAPAYEMLAPPSRIRAEVESIVPHLAAIGAGRVLDAGCAVGLHACGLAHAGRQVTGIDLSAAMIAEARARASGLGLPVRFLRRDLAAAGQIPGRPFDAVLCLGNTMASATSAAGRARTLRAFRDALRPGGLLLLQLRDLASVRFKGHVFPVRSHRRGEEEWILLRRQDPDPRGIRFRSSLLYRSGAGAGWELTESETVQPVLSAAQWRKEIGNAGFVRVLLAADLSGTPRKRGGGADLVVIARRAG
jgi:SAM-dependent methyltransferase